MTAWEHAVTRQVGHLVELYRRARGLTVAELAAKVWPEAPVGRRMVISNLENGRREGVTVAEVLALAHALNVPPLALILPREQQQEVTIGPGPDVPSTEAVRWFIGSTDEHDVPDRTARLENKLGELTRLALSAGIDPAEVMRVLT